MVSWACCLSLCDDDGARFDGSVCAVNKQLNFQGFLFLFSCALADYSFSQAFCHDFSPPLREILATDVVSASISVLILAVFRWRERCVDGLFAIFFKLTTAIASFGFAPVIECL